MNEQVTHLLDLPDTPRYNIKAVVQETQVNISTLRAWEQRYGVPHPKRSDHGHRLYSERDIGIIKWLRQCTEHGLAISQAVAMLRDRNDEHEREYSAGAAVTAQAGWPELREQLLQTLLHVDLRQAHLLVNMACTLYPLETVILELFHPVLIEIGRRWAAGDVCVAEERFATNFIRQRLLALVQLHAPFAHGRRVVCACVPGEFHELGLLAFGLLMEQRGWEVIYLGQSTSTDGLAEFLERLAPALVCASVSMAEHMPGLLEIAEAIAAKPDCRLLLGYGGRVFDEYPELVVRAPGVFLGNDLRRAVERAVALGEQIDHWLIPPSNGRLVREAW
jgi:DNA-binding transcriptional MerR regulator